MYPVGVVFGHGLRHGHRGRAAGHHGPAGLPVAARGTPSCACRSCSPPGWPDGHPDGFHERRLRLGLLQPGPQGLLQPRHHRLSVAICFFIGTIEVLGLCPPSCTSGRLLGPMANFNINTAGFVIVGMFVVTWAGALPSGGTATSRSAGGGWLTAPRPDAATGDGRQCRAGAPLFRSTLEGELPARFEERLQAAQDFVPAAAGATRLAFASRHRRPQRCTCHVVGDGELGHTASYRLDVVGESGERLGRQLGVIVIRQVWINLRGGSPRSPRRR